MLDTDLVLKSDELYLVGQRPTDGSGEQAAGLYARDTRFLDRFDIQLNGTPLGVLAVRTTAPDQAVIYASNQRFQVGGTAFESQWVAVTQRIRLTDALHVALGVRNHSRTELPMRLDVTIGADFRDLFDVRGFPRPARGRLSTPEMRGRKAVFAYHGADERDAAFEVHASRPVAGHVLAEHASGAGDGVSGPLTMTFTASVAPGEEWTVDLEGRVRPATGGAISATSVVPGRRTDVPLTMTTSDERLNDVLVRALSDLELLQTTFPEGSLPAAGIPWYVAPFGRDSLIVGLQTLKLFPARAASIIRTLAAHQATTFDEWRDMEPGKILHEVRYGEMARLGVVPHTPYYGTVDATPLWAWLLAETVAWTDDTGLWSEMLPQARLAVEWITRHGDLDGDGLIEYRFRKPDGIHIVNQGWKDSWDSLHHADGEMAVGDIALVEVQGYAYAALAGLAGCAERYGDVAWAEELRRHAERFRTLVHDRFWLPDLGFFAQALDGDKRPVAVVSSNPGHLPITGIVDDSAVATMAAKMAEPEMFTGWGLRTLSESAKTYNPMSYHNGSVWPHDNSLIVAGLAASGQVDLAARVFDGLAAAADTDRLHRLPELFCGYPRATNQEEAPIPYPVSCSPQAWAAAAIPYMLTALIGLTAGDGRSISADPRLPESLSWVEIGGLHRGGERHTLRVSRDGTGKQTWDITSVG